MNFPFPLLRGTLIKRYQRFLADVRLEGGEVVTAHCPNSGSLLHNKEPGLEVWLSRSSNPSRKLAYTWELARTAQDHWVMIHAAKANALTLEAIENGTVKELQGYESIRAEVKYGRQNSRIDLLLERPDERCYVEVKSVTLLENGTLMFPDAITTRGQKHLQELIAMKHEGHRAVIFFAALHDGSRRFAPAAHIDPDYAKLLKKAVDAGVEIVAYGAVISPGSVALRHPLSIHAG
ncbi:MAG: DNA/RNA nuclease SfsA [Campylobacterales bacterium]